MNKLIIFIIAMLAVSGCASDSSPNPEYKAFKCKQLLQRTEDPALREIQRVQARTEAAELNCWR